MAGAASLSNEELMKIAGASTPDLSRLSNEELLAAAGVKKKSLNPVETAGAAALDVVSAAPAAARAASSLAPAFQGSVIDPKTGKPIPKSVMFPPESDAEINAQIAQGYKDNPGSAIGGNIVGMFGLGTLAKAAVPAVKPFLDGGKGWNMAKGAVGQGLMGLLQRPADENGSRITQGEVGVAASLLPYGLSSLLGAGAKGVNAASRWASGMREPIAETYVAAEKAAGGIPNAAKRIFGGGKDSEVSAIAKRFSKGEEGALSQEVRERAANATENLGLKTKELTGEVDKALKGKTVPVDIDALRRVDHPAARDFVSTIDAPSIGVQNKPSGIIQVDAAEANKLRRILDKDAPHYERGTFGTRPGDVAKSAREINNARNAIRSEVNKVPEAKVANKAASDAIALEEWLGRQTAENPIGSFSSQAPDAASKFQAIDSLTGDAVKLEALNRLMAAAKATAPQSGVVSNIRRGIGRAGLLSNDLIQGAANTPAALNPYIQAIIRQRVSSGGGENGR